MRADSTKLAPRPLVAAAGPPAAWVAVTGALALWTAFAVVHHVDADLLPFGERPAKLLLYGLPVALAALLILDARSAAQRPLQLAAAWSGLVVVAELGSHLTGGSGTTMLAVPALAVAAVVLSRRPDLALTAAFAMSGFYGSLIAFWQFPEEKTVQLVLGGLGLGILWKVLVTGRDYSIKFTIGLAFTLLYVYVTVVQLVLDSGNPAAGRGFMSSAWFMLAIPVVALAGWRPSVHERVAKGIVVVAGLVGAYAVYRLATNISVTEYQRWGLDRYNYVGGKLRLLGSFPTGQDLGGWTAIVIPFCLAAAVMFDKRWRIGALVAAVLCAIALVGSQERIAVVAVALGALTVLVLHEASRGFAGRRLGTTATAIVAMVALGIAAYEITGGTSDTVTHSYSSLLRPFDRTDPSVNARLYKWDVAVRDLRSHPFGYGLGTANLQSAHLLTSHQSVGQFAVDNGFLNVALEQGFAIMVVFALAVIMLTLDLVRKAVALRERVPAGITAGAAGAMVAAFVMLWAVAFQDGPRALPIWIIAGLGLAQFTTQTARVRSEDS
jgi:hypothetical protein